MSADRIVDALLSYDERCAKPCTCGHTYGHHVVVDGEVAGCAFAARCECKGFLLVSTARKRARR